MGYDKVASTLVVHATRGVNYPDWLRNVRVTADCEGSHGNNQRFIIGKTRVEETLREVIVLLVYCSINPTASF